MTTDLYAEVTQFYARHMRAMDEGRVQDWTGDFSDDAVFITNARPDPQIGRAAIVEGAGSAAQKLLDHRVVRRHCLTTLDLETTPEGTVVANSYALIVRTPPGGPTAVEFLCTCRDELVRVGGRLLIQHRHVQRDDLAHPQP